MGDSTQPFGRNGDSVQDGDEPRPGGAQCAGNTGDPATLLAS